MIRKVPKSNAVKLTFRQGISYNEEFTVKNKPT